MKRCWLRPIGGGYDLVCCDFVYQSDNKVLWKPTYDENNSSDELRKDLIACRVPNAVWNKIVNRSIYDLHEIYSPKETMDEDDVFVCQWAYYASRCGYVHECLYFHYANPESMTHEKSREKILKGLNDRITNRKWIVNFLESKDDDDVSEAKMRYKRSVKQFIFSKGYGWKNYREMLCTYPEANKELLFSNRNSIINRTLTFLMFISFPIPFYQIAMYLLRGARYIVHKLK